MTDRHLVVAVVEPVGSHGGMDYYDSGLVGGVASQGVDVTWYTSDVSTQRGKTKIKIEHAFEGIWGGDPAWKRGLRYVKGVMRTVLHARANCAKVMHFHFFHVGVLELLSVALARVGGFAVVATVHDVEAFKPGKKSRLLQSVAYRCIGKFIVHNDISRDELTKRSGVNSRKITVIPHGSYLGLVTESVTSQLDARAQLALPEEGTVLLFFGQIKEVKGLDILLTAFGRIASKIAPCYLVIAGKVWKDDFARYEALIDKCSLREKVKLFIRYIPDEEVETFYRAADLVVLPYRRIYQSGVLLMAMSFGTPVIASDLPGMKEIITEGENGFLFASEDVDDLVTRLIDLTGNKKRLTDVAARARRTLDTDFNWADIGRRTVDVYRSVIDEVSP